MIVNIDQLKNYVLNNYAIGNEKETDMIVNSLKKELEKNNFDLNNICVDFKKTSIDFIGEDIIIRLMLVRQEYFCHKSISDYISHSRVILRPLFEKKIFFDNDIYVGLMALKKLNNNQISDSEQKDCYIKLRSDGYLFNGANNKANFCKDESGEVYLINYDDLIYINSINVYDKNKYQRYVKNELEKHVLICRDLNNEYLKYLDFASEFAFNSFKEDYDNSKKSI